MKKIIIQNIHVYKGYWQSFDTLASFMTHKRLAQVNN